MAVSSGATHDIVLRPGEGGKLDLGHVLVDAGSFALNTTTSRIYTKENLTLSPGPVSGPGGHVEIAQPRGTAKLDLRTEADRDSSTPGSQINLQNSGQRRVGSGEYTVAVTEDGAFAITIGRPAKAEQASFGSVEIVEEIVEEVEIIDLFNMSVTIEGEDNETLSRDYYCASGDWWGWRALPYLNETWLLLNDTDFIADILAEAAIQHNISNITLFNSSIANATNASLFNASFGNSSLWNASNGKHTHNLQLLVIPRPFLTGCF